MSQIKLGMDIIKSFLQCNMNIEYGVWDPVLFWTWVVIQNCAPEYAHFT